MPKKQKSSTTEIRGVKVLATMQAAQEAQQKLGAVLEEFERHKADAAAEIARIEAGLEQRLSPLRHRAATLASQVHGFAAENWTQLTDGGKTKTAVLGNSGNVEQRTSPPAVTIKDEEAVLDRFKAAGLTKYIRVKEVINRQAILDNPTTAEGILGVSIKQAESVYVRPAGSRGFMKATLGKRGKLGKWKAAWPADEELAE